MIVHTGCHGDWSLTLNVTQERYCNNHTMLLPQYGLFICFFPKQIVMFDFRNQFGWVLSSIYFISKYQYCQWYMMQSLLKCILKRGYLGVTQMALCCSAPFVILQRDCELNYSLNVVSTNLHFIIFTRFVFSACAVFFYNQNNCSVKSW